MTESLKHRQRHALVSAKAPIAAEEFVQSPDWRQLRHKRLRSFVGHCRYATVGAPDKRMNAHPHAAADQSLHLVHNGHVRNWRSLAEDRGWSLRSECDSETILRTVEDANEVRAGLAEALRVCEGSIAALMLDARREGLLWVVRNNSSPLYLLRLRNDRRLFFASTRAIMLKAFSRVLREGWEQRIDLLIPVASGTVHAVVPEGGMIAMAA
jgi:glucosamine 6-phosphate synthetase-like amidotransferase/phosphosugar isomerase protein